MTVTETGTGTAAVVAGVLTEGGGTVAAAGGTGGEGEEGAMAVAGVEAGRATTAPVKGDVIVVVDVCGRSWLFSEVGLVFFLSAACSFSRRERAWQRFVR